MLPILEQVEPGLLWQKYLSNTEQFIEVRPTVLHRSPGWPWECRAARRVPQAQQARRRWAPFLPCVMEPRTPHPRRPQALRRCLRRGLDLLGHFSEDHGKTSRSSHTSKEVDARWSTRATKHIGKEYLGNTREENRAGERERERERGAGIPRWIGRSKLASEFFFHVPR